MPQKGGIMERDPDLDTLTGRIINYAIMFACIALLVFVLWAILPYVDAWLHPPPL